MGEQDWRDMLYTCRSHTLEQQLLNYKKASANLNEAICELLLNNRLIKKIKKLFRKRHIPIAFLRQGYGEYNRDFNIRCNKCGNQDNVRVEIINCTHKEDDLLSIELSFHCPKCGWNNIEIARFAKYREI